MNSKYRYGQQNYDFDEGLMFFMAPQQLFGVKVDDEYKKPTGWMLLIHPDFLWNTSLARSIKNYDFFHYAINEALFLSEDEERKVQQIIQNIEEEYKKDIDQFSQSIMISQLETLLNYSDRFYNRQFITRQKRNHQILEQLEIVLDLYINESLDKGVPNVASISENLNISPNYLSKLVKDLTGKNTQQLIHEKLIDKAKEKLTTTNLTVSEIAYELGFEYSQSFSRLFKQKAGQSPLEFRQSFN